MKRKTLGAALAVWFFSLSPKASADSCSISRIRTLNNRAFSDCLSYKYDEAKGLLDAAAALIVSGGCTMSLDAARTYLLLGIVEYAGFKNENKAKAAWASALRIRPQLALPAQLATAALNRFFNKVKSDLAGARAAPTKPRQGPIEPARPVLPPPAEPPRDRPAKPLPHPQSTPHHAKPGSGGSWRNVFMPKNPSLYGLGNPFTWDEYRKGRTAYRVGLGITLITGITASVCSIAASSMVTDKEHKSEMTALFVTAGVALTLSLIGALISYYGAKKQKEAGYMIFKTKSDQPTAPSRPDEPSRRPSDRGPTEESF